MSEAKRKLISIVTPCYNEEQNILSLFQRVSAAIAPLRAKYDFEFIYTDNCSQDRTYALLTQLASEHRNFRVLRFSRNIGAARAMIFGLEAAKGDAALLIQADLQDPPELIPQFVQGWEEGNEVVYGRILNREEGLVIQTLRRIYYRVIARLSDIPIPENAGDFRLTSRRVLEALTLYKEYDPYIRGAVAHIGFRQKEIPYVRQPRAGGQSSSGLGYLFGFALNGLISTTVVPIRTVTILGFAMSVLGFVLLFTLFLSRFLFPSAAPHGFTTLALLILMFAGVQTFALGVIGEYIRKIYVETLRRPRGFIQDVCESHGAEPESQRD